MLIVEKISDEYFTVNHKYSEDYNKRFRDVPGQLYDRELKKRIIPISSFPIFEFTFLGEIIYKTPKWEITGEQMPDYTKNYVLENKDLKLPKLKINPYDYQLYGARYMIEKIDKYGFVINADSVGLGKTIQAIQVMYHYISTGKVKNVLLLCKKALKFQWKNEIEKFTDYDMNKIVILDGTTNKKVKQAKEFKELTDGKILISNYEVTQAKCFEELKDIKFDMLIIDEAHIISNKGVKNKEITKLSKDIDYKIFLTGTPIMSKPDNIYDIVSIATKKYFGKWKEFQEKHIKKEYSRFGMQTVGYMDLDELQEKAQEITIRRTENEVAIELPDMLPPKEVICSMDKTQIKILETIEEEKTKLNAIIFDLKAKADKDEDDYEKLAKLEAASKGLIASVQAVADDPRLFLLSKSESIKKTYGPLIPKSYAMSPKTETLLEIVEEIVDSGEKVIIFTKFERAAQMLKNDIESTFKSKDGYNVSLFTGEVDSENRQLNVKYFNESNTHNIFIATDAGAEG